MPPRRTRSAKEPAPVNKRTKRELPESVPQRPQTDTYTPPSTTQTRDTIKNIIKKKSNVTGALQIRLSVSSTEASIVKTAQDAIQKDSGAILVVSDPVEGSVERDISITGNHKQIVEAVTLISLTLEEAVCNSLGEEHRFHTTILVQASDVSSIKWIFEEPSIDVSDEFVPFSNFKSIYISSTLDKFIGLVFDILKGLPQPDENVVTYLPTTKVSIIGSHLPLKRSQENQSLLEKSKTAFARYLKQESPAKEESMDITTSKLDQDPLTTSQEQIQKAIEQCQTKSTESFRTIIDVPVDQVSGIIGKSGVKINEIRAKSNCNVNIDDSIKNGVFRALTIIGTGQGQLIALQYLAGLVQ